MSRNGSTGGSAPVSPAGVGGYAEEQPGGYVAGFACLVGRPNAGKSTLMNTLLAEKLAIVSDKPQTTRNRLVGILSDQQGQMVFYDTPGVHRPQHRMNRQMVKAAQDKLKAGANGSEERMKAKLVTGKFFMERVLPESATHFKLLPLYQRAMRDGKLSGERFDGYWTNIGTPAQLRAAISTLPRAGEG